MGYRSCGAMWFSQQALDAISEEDNDLIKRDIENNNFAHVHRNMFFRLLLNHLIVFIFP